MPVSTKTRRLRKLLLVAMAQGELGERIKAARKAAGLTQPQLAARVGLEHPQSISNYERGISEVPPSRLRKIAAATGRPLSFFVEEVTPPDVHAELSALREEQTEQAKELAAVRALAEEIKLLVSPPEQRASRS